MPSQLRIQNNEQAAQILPLNRLNRPNDSLEIYRDQM
jgi:hypothetical protein